MGMAAAGTERRGAERFTLRHRTVLTLSTGGRSYLASLDDLSWSGARLHVVASMVSDGPITLHHPAVGNLTGEQVWRRGSDIGVRFTAPARALERTLQCINLLLHRDGVPA